MVNLVILLVLFIPGMLCSLYVGVYSWWYVDEIGSRFLSLSSFAVFVWLFGYCVEVMYSVSSWVDGVAIQVHFVGIIVFSVSFFLFSVRYVTGYSFSVFELGLLVFVPVVNLGLVLTNSVHGLFWASKSEVVELTLLFSKLDFTPVLMVHTIYSYLLVFVASVFFIRLAYTQRGSYFVQSSLIIFGVALPFILSVAYVGDLIPFSQLDIAPIALGFSQFIFLIALYRTEFLSVVPGIRNFGWGYIARNVDVGIIISNNGGEVIQANVMACELFGFAGESEFIGVEIAELFGERGLVENESLEVGGSVVQVSSEAIRDNKGKSIGYVYTVTDITKERRVRRQIQMLNRFLRHNLRNELSVIQLNAEQFDSGGVSGDVIDSEDAVETIRNRTEKLIDMSESVRAIEESVLDDTYISRDVGEIVNESISAAGEGSMVSVESISVYNELEGDEVVQVCSNFSIGLKQILINAFVHGSPPVEVHIVEESDDLISICVLDSGSGIAETVIDDFYAELESEFENQLQHGVGLGFGIAYWAAMNSGGEVTFVSGEESSGGEVVFTLQKDSA